MLLLRLFTGQEGQVICTIYVDDVLVLHCIGHSARSVVYYQAGSPTDDVVTLLFSDG
jgi:hypothetical protein